MEQFSLEKWLKDKSRKVITRDGRPVRIVCWDRKTTYWKIIGLVSSPDSSTENPFTYDVNGNESDGCLHNNRNDLFFADEEEELTEFDYAVLSIISDHNSHTDSIESFAKRSSKKLLDLARKEILKDFPKWKTYEGELIGTGLSFKDNVNLVLVRNGYYIDVNELEKLPKEE